MNSDCEMYSGLDGWEEQIVGLNPAMRFGRGGGERRPQINAD
jgi:hypothetical protein